MFKLREMYCNVPAQERWVYPQYSAAGS